MSELALTSQHTAPALPDDLRFVAEMGQAAHLLAQSSMVPREYQGNPANIVLAAGLGRGMGLDVFQSMQRITVIQGKPTASAELILANVRKAGHKVEMSIDEKALTATCTITRGDDGTVTTITRDMTWAKRMGLDSKDNYKKQPSTMLAWRAGSAAARIACPEALYGVAYTPDEIETVPATVVRSAADYDTPAPAAIDQPAVEETGEAITPETAKQLFTVLKGTEAEQKAAVEAVVEHPVDDPWQLTEAEGRKVIEALRGAE